MHLISFRKSRPIPSAEVRCKASFSSALSARVCNSRLCLSFQAKHGRGKGAAYGRSLLFPCLTSDCKYENPGKKALRKSEELLRILSHPIRTRLSNRILSLRRPESPFFLFFSSPLDFPQACRRVRSFWSWILSVLGLGNPGLHQVLFDISEEKEVERENSVYLSRMLFLLIRLSRGLLLEESTLQAHSSTGID